MLLVHVAGAADLGIPLIVVGQRRSPEETAELTARRTAELDAARRTGWEIYPSAVPGLVGSLRAGWDGRPLDLTEPPDAELLAQVAAGGTRSGGGRATS